MKKMALIVAMTLTVLAACSTSTPDELHRTEDAVNLGLSAWAGGARRAPGVPSSPTVFLLVPRRSATIPRPCCHPAFSGQTPFA